MSSVGSRVAAAPTWLLVAGMVVLALALRTAMIIVWPAPLESDFLGYWLSANSMLKGETVQVVGQPTAFANLGYPIFLTALYSVTGASVLAGMAANAVLAALNVVLAFVIARRLFASTVSGLIAAFLTAILMDGSVYAAALAKETLMTTLILGLLAIAAAPNGWDRRSALVLRAAGFGVLAGALAMVGNAGLVLLPGMAVLLAWRLPLPRLMAFGVVAAVVGAATIGPLLWRNHSVLGVWQLNTNAGVNLYIGNNPNADLTFMDLGTTPLGKDWLTQQRGMGEVAWERKLKALALETMAADPWGTAKRMVRRFVYFWEPPPLMGRPSDPALARVARVVDAAIFCAVLLLFVIALREWRRHGWALAGLVIMALAYAAVHAVFYLMVRYRVPLIPVLCIGAGMGGEVMLRWAGRHLPAGLIPFRP